jgi:hypothetical protein
MANTLNTQPQDRSLSASQTANTSVKWRRLNIALHKRLLWWGALCVLIWTISGLTHPLMSWFGPEQANYRPPSLNLTISDVPSGQSLRANAVSLTQLQSMSQLLVANQRERVSIAKVVPSQDGAMLQLTYDQQSARQYLPLNALLVNDSVMSSESLFEVARLDDYDRKQAQWLAEHFTGRSEDEIESVEFITQFSGEYPWVNRLLPVYKVKYQGDDQLTAFVHTETLQLASLANQTRFQMQAVFRALHTFDFLDEHNNVRVAGVLLAMLILVSVSLSGLGLVILLARRKIKSVERRWHRRLGYFIWLPLFAWSISGGYHLIQSAYVDSPAGMRLNSSFAFTDINVSDLDLSIELSHLDSLQGKSILAASLIALNENLLLRLSVADRKPKADVPAGPHAHHQQLVKKYRGRPNEVSSVYLDALTLETVNYSDSMRAQSIANQFYHQQASSASEASIIDVQKISRFGPGYDFRNKRLPVWKVSYQDAQSSELFVDPVTSILVDQSRVIDRAERWSFSLLHKWNFLTPFTGRFNRDILIVIVLVLLTAMTVFGIRMGLLKRFSKRVIKK